LFPVRVLNEPSTRIAIKHTQAPHLVGKSVKICSTIYGGRCLEQTKRSLTFLNVEGNYPDAPLTFVIWNDVRTQFKYMPEDILKGKECVYGKILYKNKPEIVITIQTKYRNQLNKARNDITFLPW